MSAAGHIGEDTERGSGSHSVFPPYRITWHGLFSQAWLPTGVRPSLEFDHIFDGPVGDVYAASKRQNLRNRPGKYYFWLARNLDTEMLADGVHTILVFAFDIRGNETSRSAPSL